MFWRKKNSKIVSDASLGMPDVLGLLNSYDGEVNVVYKLPSGKKARFVEANGSEIADFLMENFCLDEKHYCEIRHKVYDNDNQGSRKHHIEVRKGEILAFFRGEEIRVGPNAKMDIDYVVKLP